MALEWYELYESYRKLLSVTVFTFGLFLVAGMTKAQEFKAESIVSFDNVTVMEVEGSYDTPTMNDPSNSIPRQIICKEFYKTHDDDYDFIVIFSNFSFQMPRYLIAGKVYTAAAFYSGVRNDIQGIGKDLFDRSLEYGSRNRLQGTIDMGYIVEKTSNPSDPRFVQTMTTLSHELLHRWAAFVTFKDENNEISKALMDSSEAHWSYLFNTKGSLMYGNWWQDNGDGTFTSLPGDKYYGPLDLYLMGLKDKSEIEPMLLIDNPAINKDKLPDSGVTIEGTVRTVTIDNIIASEGERIPNALNSQKKFKIGCVLITRPGTFSGESEVIGVRNILKNFVFWFSSLTDGKAQVHIDTTPIDDLPVNPGKTPVYDPRTTPPEILDGVAWLTANQALNGSWRDSEETVERDTAVAVDALKNFPDTGQNISSGLGWLEQIESKNTDYLSRKIISFKCHGREFGPLLDALLDRRNHDGGWGSDTEYASNTTDTSRVLRALSEIEYSNAHVVGAAVEYLKENKNHDNGWGSSNDGQFSSDILTTLNVLHVFIHYRDTYELNDLIQDGLAFLYTRQRADGGFGNQLSTIYHTAGVLRLFKLFPVARDKTNSALYYLLGLQSENGSWYNSSYQTALAVETMLLWQDNIATDLSVAFPDISFDPDTVTSIPQDVSVKAVIWNHGLIRVTGVPVALYDGEITEAGKVGEAIIDIGAKAFSEALFSVTTRDADPHTFFVVVDPDAIIEEKDKTNNTASRVLVNEACDKADLYINPDEVFFTPPEITQLPRNLQITFKVHNIGHAGAAKVKIAVYDGAAFIKEFLIPEIPAGSFVERSVTRTIVDGDIHTFHFKADPGGEISECLEINNHIVKDFFPKTTYDFIIEASDIIIQPNPVNRGESVTIRSRISNQGTSTGSEVPIRYFIDGPGDPILISETNVTVPYNGTVDHEVSWLADVVGDNMNLAVFVDPENLTQELAEDNNKATASLTVLQYTDPDLAVSHEDLVFDPIPALENGSVSISALIQNQGFSEARDAVVQFIRVLNNENIILNTQIISALPAGGSIPVVFTWESIPVSGHQDISVRVDPENTIQEIDENNNRTFSSLDVLSLPDLAVSNHSMTLTPEAPRQGEMVRVDVDVQNMGNQDAADVTVVMQDDSGVIESGTIPLIKGNTAAVISFNYDTAGKVGVHEIEVRVDPDNQILERSTDNNRAVRRIGVQDADLWLSEPIISPNGDGVKDDTQFTFRLEAPRSVNITIVNSRQETVRTFTDPAFENTLGGSVVWNGFNDDGMVVQDGEYKVQVRDAGGAVLAGLLIIVDNNRSSLVEAVGTKYMYHQNLTCLLPDIESWQWLPDESGMIAYISEKDDDAPEFPDGIYFISPDGETVRRLGDEKWQGNLDPDLRYYYTIDQHREGFSISPDGKHVAVILRMNDRNLDKKEYQLWVLDPDGESRTKLVSHDYLAPDWPAISEVYWGPDSQYLAYIIETDNGGNRHDEIRMIRTEDPGHTVSFPALGNERYDYISWSPDGARLALYDEKNDRVVTADMSGNIFELMAVNDSIRAMQWQNNARLFAQTWENFWSIHVSGDQDKHKKINIEDGFNSGDFNLHPGGDRVAYAVHDDDAYGYSATDKDTVINICDFNGGCSTVYQTPSIFYEQIEDLIWSPDGDKLAFFNQYHEWVEECYYNGHIVILDIETNEALNVKISQREEPCGGGDGGGSLLTLSGPEPDESVDYLGRLAWLQDNRHLLGENDHGMFVVGPSQEIAQYVPIKINNTWDILKPELSVNGKYINYTLGVNQESICSNRGSEDLWLLGSLLNLTADLRAVKNSNAITLRGIAADLNFREYRLEYAEFDNPDTWLPVAPPSDRMVVNEDFIDWVPPGEGIYLVRLTVKDKAGNTARDRTRVSWGRAFSIAGLYKNHDFFSPNNDQVMETARLYFQVLEPVHLQFFIYDENESRVRTIHQEYISPAESAFIEWDGTDDGGNMLSEGVYRVKVLNYEFFFELDISPPELYLNLPEHPVARGEEISKLTDETVFKKCGAIQSEILGRAVDKNIKEWILEYGEGENPQEWYLLEKGQGNLYQKDNSENSDPVQIISFKDENLDFVMGKRFRISATDQAGNKSTRVNDSVLFEELIVLREWDDFIIDYMNHTTDTIKACELLPRRMLMPGTHIIRGVENINHPISFVNLQYQINGQWYDAHTETEKSSGLIELVWNYPYDDIKKVDYLRLRAFDINQKDYYSIPVRSKRPVFMINPATSVQPKCINTDLPFHARGIIDIPEHLKRLILQVKSPNDQQYLIWTDYLEYSNDNGNTIPNGDFSFIFPNDLKPKMNYQFRMLGDGEDGRRYESNIANLPSVCSDVEEDISVVLSVRWLAGECDFISPKAVLSGGIDMQEAGKLDFVTLESLTYYIKDPVDWQVLGEYDLTNSFFRSHIISTVDMAEGKYPVKVELKYTSHDIQPKYSVDEQTLTVDRKMPDVKIAYPTGGPEIVCPILQDGGWYGIAIEGQVQDENLTFYEVFFTYGEESDDWIPAVTLDSDLNPYQIAGESSVHGEIGIFNVSDLDKMRLGQNPMIRLKIEATDIAENKKCEFVNVPLDTSIQINGQCNVHLISPNGDGMLDQAVIEYTIEEESLVNLNVIRKDDSSVVKTVLLNHLHPGATGMTVWHGKNEFNQYVVDGEYQVQVLVNDACGNRIDGTIDTIEVDLTPPDIHVYYPLSDDRPGLVVEVRGSVSDLNFESYRLEIEDTGELLEEGTLPMQDKVLGSWDRGDLTGIHYLKLIAHDRAGNEKKQRIMVRLEPIGDLIQNLSVHPKLFSPNDDGRLEFTEIKYRLNPAVTGGYNVTFDVYHEGAVVVSHTETDVGGGDRIWQWFGRNQSGGIVPDGEKVVVVKAERAGDPSVNQTEQVTVITDVLPPVVEIVEPSVNSYIKGKPAEILGTISDANLKSYEITLDGQGGSISVDTGNKNKTDHTFARLEDLADGPYTLTARAEDQVQIISEHTVLFYVDKTSPKVSITAPLNQSLFGHTKNMVEIKGTVEEENLEYWILRYGGGTTPEQWTELSSGDSVPGSGILYTWSVGMDANIPDGPYTVSLVAGDKAGWTTEARTSVIVDNTAPVVILDSPADGSYVTTPVDITGSVQDQNLKTYTVELSDGACEAAERWMVLKTSEKEITNSVIGSLNPLPGDGVYCLRVKAGDEVGQITENQVRVIVDTTPPAPPVLKGQVLNKADASLSWSRNSEPDLAGYHLYRDNQRINAQLLSDILYTDTGFSEGTYVYTVRAVDLAGLESAPSNKIELKIDLIPPSARLSVPLDGSMVSDLVAIKGTAHSMDDFKEYRVFTGVGQDPSSWNILNRSYVPTSFGRLADWDTIQLSEGVYSIKLEAEDLAGNINIHQIRVNIDNTPPNRPVILRAESTDPMSPDVEVEWALDPTPSDLAGFLLYRNHGLVNVSGLVIGDLKPYLLSGTSYDDPGLPDGTHTYYVLAMDRAGNMSEQSESVEVNIDTHPPHMIIKAPGDGFNFEHTIMIQAESEDRDVASVQFQYKPESGAWIDLGPARTIEPFAVYLDPVDLGLTYGIYHIRAVATDNGGRTDDAPEEITVIYRDMTPPALPTGLNTLVNAGTVRIAWNAGTDGDLAGYYIYRVEGETRTRLNIDPRVENVYEHTNLDDDFYTYEVTSVDTSDNESRPAGPLTARVYTPVMEQPYTPSEMPDIHVKGSNAEINADVELFVDAETIPVSADDDGRFNAGITLSLGENHISARAVDADGNISKTSGSVIVVYNEAPAVPVGLTADAIDYNVSLAWTPSTEDDLAGYYVHRNGARLNGPSTITPDDGQISASSNYNTEKVFDGNGDSYWQDYLHNAGDTAWWRFDFNELTLIRHFEIDWQHTDYYPYAARDFKIQAWSGHAWITLFDVQGNESASNVFELNRPYGTDRIRVSITDSNDEGYAKKIRMTEIRMIRDNPVQFIQGDVFLDANLADGVYDYQVSAVDIYGLESELSGTATAEVGDVVPPVQPLELTAAATGADVSLNWQASGDLNLAGYHVYRKTDDQWTRVNHTLIPDNHYQDEGLPNNTHTYRVTAVDMAGNESIPSNEASAVIENQLPQTPLDLNVTVAPEGEVLTVCWEETGQPVHGYNLYRTTDSGTSYTLVNEEPIAGTCWTDTGLVNGQTYYYIVVAVDEYGNESQSSNEKSSIPLDSTAPESPIIGAPTVSHIPMAVNVNRSSIGGVSEPGSLIKIYRNGEFISSATSTLEHQYQSEVNHDYRMTLSPDGTRVAYQYRDPAKGDRALLIKELGPGGDTQKILNNAYDPVWSPDGRKIAYKFYKDGNYQVAVYELGIGVSVPLTEETDAEENYPGWSADGQSIVFRSDRLGGDRIWIKDLKSGDLTQVTETGSYRYPRLSPDNTRVLYASGGRLIVKELNGPGQVVVTLEFASLDEYLQGYAWSPDGNTVAYVGYHNSVPGIFGHDIAANTTFMINDLTNMGPNFRIRGICWSPAGESIGYYIADPYEQKMELRRVRVGSPLEVQVLYQWEYGWLDSLEWTKSGKIAISTDEWMNIILPKGWFNIPDARLVNGENHIHAIAEDASGNLSQASDPIMIDLSGELLPDLEVKKEDIFIYPLAPLLGESTVIGAVVHNMSTLPAENVGVDIYLLDAHGRMQMLKTETIPVMDAGSSRAVTVDWDSSGSLGANSIYVFIDTDNLVLEASEANNVASKDFHVVLEQGLAVETELARDRYDSHQEVDIYTRINNSGPYKNATIEVRIENELDEISDVIDTIQMDLLYGDIKNFHLTWNTEDIQPGQYQVHTILREADSVLVENIIPLEVMADISAACSIRTDKAHYGPDEDARLTARIENTSANSDLSGLTVRAWIQPKGQAEVFTRTWEIEGLMIGSSVDLDADWNTGRSPAGDYTAGMELVHEGITLSEHIRDFTIDPAGRLTGQITVVPQVISIGNNVQAEYSVENQGNADVSGLVLKILAVHPDTMEIIDSREETIDLAMDQTHSNEVTLGTSGLEVRTYQLLFQAETNPSVKTLASTSFTVIDGMPPEIAVLSPEDGGVYQITTTPRISLSVQATDNASGIERVEYRIDDKTWQIMLGSDPAAGLFTAYWEPGQADEGDRYISFRAKDRAGNESSPTRVRIRIEVMSAFDRLTGTLTAEPAQVIQGLEESFLYTVANDTDQELADITLQVRVVDPDTQEVKLTNEKVETLSARSVTSGVLRSPTISLDTKSYQAELRVISQDAPEPRTLDEAGFEVLPSLEADKRIGDPINVLVWLNHWNHPGCPGHGDDDEDEEGEGDDGDDEDEDGEGDDDGDDDDEGDDGRGHHRHCKNSHKEHPCGHHCHAHDSVRIDLLEAILNEAASDYRIVYGRKTFAQELRNPYYTDILILGNAQKPGHQALAELRERVHSGTGLVSSLFLGHTCWNTMFGVKYKGRLSGRHYHVHTLDSLVSSEGYFEENGRLYRIQIQDGTTVAGWLERISAGSNQKNRYEGKCHPSSQYPGIVLNDYGQGKTVYFAFDLGMTLGDESYDQIRELVQKSLAHVHGEVRPDTFKPYSFIPIDLDVTSLGTGFDLKIIESFPRELELYDPVTHTWTRRGSWEREIHLDPDVSTLFRYYFMSPGYTGIYTPLTEISFKLDTIDVFFKNLSVEFQVAGDTAQRIEEIRQDLDSLDLSGCDRRKAEYVMKYLNRAKNRVLENREDIEDNIRDVLRAVFILKTIHKTDTSPIRIKIDQILRIQQGRFYLYVPPEEYLTGTLAADPLQVEAGGEIAFNYSVFNGSLVNLDQMAIRVDLIDPSGNAEDTLEEIRDLPMSVSVDGQMSTPTTDFKPGIYSAELSARSNKGEPKNLAAAEFQVLAELHPPVAVAGGPYLSVVGEEIWVDGTGSHDLNQGTSETGLPPHDFITGYGWETLMQPPFDFNDALGENAVLSPYEAPGTHEIGLRVTDNTLVAFPGSGGPDLTGEDFGQVMVFTQGVHNLRVKKRGSRAELKWDKTGAGDYDILRSDKGSNHGFIKIGQTHKNKYKDKKVNKHQDHWYRIRAEINGETVLSIPVHFKRE